MTGSEDSRRSAILALLMAGDPDTSLVERICDVSARLLGISGAGMCVIGGTSHQIIVHGTDALVESLEDLQVELGEGPCIESVRTGVPILVPDLGVELAPNWREYVDRATALGVRALFTFPLISGDIRVGALDLYRMSPGPLGAHRTADALMLADIATRSMLAQEDRSYPDGSVSALQWLVGPAAAGRGRPVDHGLTVGQAEAQLGSGGSNGVLGPSSETDPADR